MSRKKTERIHLRVSELEKSQLNTLAESANLSLSDFVVKVGLGIAISAPRPTIEKEAVQELARIGNNLNQIVRVANSGGDVNSDAMLAIAEQLKELRRVVK